MQSNAMKADNLITFIIKEAQHQVINDKHTKTAKLVLAAHTKGSGKSKGKKNPRVSQISLVQTVIGLVMVNQIVTQKVVARKAKDHSKGERQRPRSLKWWL